MANVKVIVTSPTAFFDLIMDDTAVDTYVGAAKTLGYFKSPGTTTEETVYIPYNESSAILVKDENYEFAGRDQIGNF